ELNREGAALVDDAVDPNRPAKASDQALRERQAQSGALDQAGLRPLAAEEFGKKFVDLLGQQSDAIVLDVPGDESRLGRELDLYLSLRGRVFDRIRYQVGQDLAQRQVHSQQIDSFRRTAVQQLLTLGFSEWPVRLNNLLGERPDIDHRHHVVAL